MYECNNNADISNNLALKTHVSWNSTAPLLAFESVAKRHGEASASLIKILRTHQVNISKTYMLNTVLSLYGPLTFSVFKHGEAVLLRSFRR